MTQLSLFAAPVPAAAPAAAAPPAPAAAPAADPLDQELGRLIRRADTLSASRFGLARLAEVCGLILVRYRAAPPATAPIWAAAARRAASRWSGVRGRGAMVARLRALLALLPAQAVAS